MKKTLIMSFRPKRRNLLGIKSKLHIKRKIHVIYIGLITLNLQLLTPNSFSQNVGVNDNGAAPNANAILDVDASSNDKGLLIPRITTAQRTGISGLGAGDEGLTVYDETTTSFWFWDGAQWVEIAQTGQDWSIAGNSGTVDGTNFIGTTDNVPLNFRINNLASGKITTAATFFGYQAGVVNTSNNTGIGSQALFSNVGGNNNTALGLLTLYSNVTGNHNTGIGREALYSNSSGSSNTATGYRSLYSNTGSSNTANGVSSLFSNTSGTHNTAMGVSTLHDNTTGIENTIIGSNAMRNSTIGDANSSLGYRALYNNTEGSNNTAIGHQSLYSNTTGNNATAVGYGAMYYANNSATAFTNTNVAIGYEALRGSTNAANNTGVNNTAVGYQSLYSVTSGVNNTANGYRALYDNSTGTSNTAIGNHAMRKNQTGLDNSAFGQNALYSNIGGNYNVSIGQNSMYWNNNAGYNTAIGYHTLFTQSYNNSGTSWNSYNVALGYNALRYNQPTATNNGINNTGLGTLALFRNTTGRDNVGIGYEANNFNQTGSSNTIIGYQAGRGTALHNKSGNIFIGYQAGYNETGSNLLYIENSNSSTPLIWGNFSNNRVGINRVATTNTLEISGNASKATAGDWLGNSDIRLKTDIIPINSEAILNKLLSLKGITYRWNDDKTGYQRPTGIQYGFSAQNIQEVFPTLVSEDDQGYLQAAYGTYDAMTIEAIRALNNKIEDLVIENNGYQQKIEAQNVEMVDQQKQIAELESKIERRDREMELRIKQLEQHLKTAIK